MTNILTNIRLYLVLLVVAIFFAVSVVFPLPSITVPTNTGNTVALEQDDTLLAVNATILEVVSGHAWEGHGTEVNDAIRCLNNRGSTMSFQTFGFKDEKGNPLKTNLWLCRDGDDWYAIVTTSLEKMGGNRIGRLITAYLIDKKNFMVIGDFIAKVKDKWLAREISFVIEAGSVFLQPK